MPLLLGTVVVGLVIITYVWRTTRAGAMLDEWAKNNGLQFIRREYRHFSKGPFFWTSSDHQVVYYIVVRDQKGVERSGYARCGGWFLGMLSENVEVRWDS